LHGFSLEKGNQERPEEGREGLLDGLH